MKKLTLVMLILLFLSCSQKKISKANNFETKLFTKIDSFHCDSGIKRLLLVRHQQINNQDYIQIKVDYDFNLDSLAYFREKNGVISAFYNNEYFKKKINYSVIERDSLLKKYDYLSNTNTEKILYHNFCQEIYEVKNDSLILVNENNPVYSRLFNYPSTFVPEPPPSKK